MCNKAKNVLMFSLLLIVRNNGNSHKKIGCDELLLSLQNEQFGKQYHASPLAAVIALRGLL